MEYNDYETGKELIQKLTGLSITGMVIVEHHIQELTIEFGTSPEWQNELYRQILIRVGAMNTLQLDSLKQLAWIVNTVTVHNWDGISFLTACLAMGWLAYISEKSLEKIEPFADALLNYQEELEMTILPTIQSLQIVRLYSDSHKKSISVLLRVLAHIKSNSQNGVVALSESVPEERLNAITTVGRDASFAFAIYIVERYKLHQVSQFLIYPNH